MQKITPKMLDDLVAGCEIASGDYLGSTQLFGKSLVNLGSLGKCRICYNQTESKNILCIENWYIQHIGLTIEYSFNYIEDSSLEYLNLPDDGMSRQRHLEKRCAEVLQMIEEDSKT